MTALKLTKSHAFDILEVGVQQMSKSANFPMARGNYSHPQTLTGQILQDLLSCRISKATGANHPMGAALQRPSVAVKSCSHVKGLRGRSTLAVHISNRCDARCYQRSSDDEHNCDISSLKRRSWRKFIYSTSMSVTGQHP